MVNQRYQVFVSSTYIDLIEERQKVMQALLELNCIPAGMEWFPAMDDEQFEVIKTVIDDSDYFVLIIGGRYGSESAIDKISYTEKEFDYAIEKGLKILAFIHENPKTLPVEKYDTSLTAQRKLNKFKKKVMTSRMVKFWNNSDELAGFVSRGLSLTMKTHPATGWIRGDAAITDGKLLSEYAELKKKYEETLQVIEYRDEIKNRNLAMYLFLESLEKLDVFAKSKQYILKILHDVYKYILNLGEIKNKEEILNITSNLFNIYLEYLTYLEIQVDKNDTKRMAECIESMRNVWQYVYLKEMLVNLIVEEKDVEFAWKLVEKDKYSQIEQIKSCEKDNPTNNIYWDESEVDKIVYDKYGYDDTVNPLFITKKEFINWRYRGYMGGRSSTDFDLVRI